MAMGCIWMGRGSGFERFGGEPVAVIEQALEFAANEPSGQQLAKPAKRELVDDFVFEETGFGAVGKESVGMFPTAKRAAHLHIAELAAGDNVAVLGYPQKPERADPESDLRAVFDFAGAPDDAHFLPGLREPFERSRFSVPAENSFRRREKTGPLPE
jgi:hypothetical protein